MLTIWYITGRGQFVSCLPQIRESEYPCVHSFLGIRRLLAAQAKTLTLGAWLIVPVVGRVQYRRGLWKSDYYLAYVLY